MAHHFTRFPVLKDDQSSVERKRKEKASDNAVKLNESLYLQYLSKQCLLDLGVLYIRGCYDQSLSPRFHESHTSSH